MVPWRFVTVLTIILSNIINVSALNLRPLGSFHVSNPGFLTLIGAESGTGHALYISSFSGIPFSTDHVYRVSDINTHLTDLSSVRPTLITDDVIWPNEVQEIPKNVFNRSMISVSSGFLVPFKTKGTLTLFDISKDTTTGPYDITNTRADHGWFYHRVMWADMNGDGAVDAVTCRAKHPTFGAAHGELLWFEHPVQGLYEDDMAYPWHPHVIGDGADTFFDMTSFQTPDGTFSVIVTAGYFSDQLRISWTTDTQGKWTDKSKIHTRVIDSSIGHVFDVQIEDINMDGKTDLLVTSNAAHGAGLYVFEVPSDFRTGHFNRHVLMTGFKANSFLPGSGAPGSAQIIKDTSLPRPQKPSIILSGDDDSAAYVLTPSSSAVSDWTYTNNTILNLHHGTIGEIAHGDVDGDGHLELFIPAYSANSVYVYTLKPPIK